MPVESSGKVSSGQIKNLAVAGLDRGLILSAHLVAQRATQLAPIDTGRLKRSITSGRPFSRPGGARTIEVGSNVEYARIHELGGIIPSHEVHPRIKKALAFTWHGEDWVLKRVTIPDVRIPPRPYLRPALRNSRHEIRTLIVKSVMGMINS